MVNKERNLLGISTKDTWAKCALAILLAHKEAFEKNKVHKLHP